MKTTAASAAPTALRRRPRWRKHLYPALFIGFLLVAGGCAAALVLGSRVPTAEPVGRADRPIVTLDRVPGLQANLAARVGVERRLQPLIAEYSTGSMCVAFAQDEGSILIDHNADATFVPASTQKLLTATAALGVLGEERRFRTEVVQGSDGSLYLRGGGDPTLASPEWIAANPDRLATPIAELGARLAEAGVRTAGGIVADPSYLDTAFYVDGWEQRFISDRTAPRVQALAVDRSRTVFPGGVPVPSGAESRPALGAAATLTRLTGNPGAPVREDTTPPDATVVASVESPPLRDIVKDMNKWSDNYIAEVLVRHVGLEASGTGTTEAGVAAVTAYLTSIGVDTADLELVDGSGLHYGNRLSCDEILDVIPEALAEPSGQALVDSLAVGGTDGTLRSRDVPATVHAKTGTLQDVSTLAGLIDTADGRMPFAVLMNAVPDGLDTRGLQDRLIAALASWPNP